MEVAVLISTGVLAAALGIVLGRYVWPAVRGSDPDALAKAQTEVARLEQDSIALRSRADQLDADHKAASGEARRAAEEVARLTERVAGLTKRSQEQSEQNSALEAQRDKAASEAEAARVEVAQLKERESALAEKIDTQTGQFADRVAGLMKRSQEQSEQNSALEAQRDKAASEAEAARVEVAQLKERESALAQKIDTQTGQFAELQKQLTAEFENVANRILKANVTELSENSQKALASILDPLRERIQEFQKKVETTYEAESREVFSLKDQIKLIVETSNAIGNQADGLTKALRGDSQLLGRWGELALERILEAAGLTEGREYISQGRGLGLKNEAGGVQKPDIIVMLPENRTMIVDSKVPLTSYERLIAAKDEAERAICADQLVRDVKGHIDGLAGKRYQENEKLQAHDCVLMFVPIEGALAGALTREPELFVYAWDRRVVLVGPPTLLMTMRTVASIWRYEDQGQNAQKIASLAGSLCDKVSASLIDLNAVAEKIAGALNAHNEAVRRLSTGKGNALSVGEHIRSLGVKTKRPMPSMLVDGVSIAASTEDFEENISSAAGGE